MSWWRVAKAKIRNLFSRKQGPKAEVSHKTYIIPQELRDEYLKNWNRAEITEQTRLDRGLQKVRPNYDEYRKISKQLGCSLFALICSHYREASCDLDRQILNGQPWDIKTSIVPKGEGPFNDFVESCERGFEIKPEMENPNNIIDLLHFLERWNGWGYRRRGILSPYLWAGTNLYTKGYYTSDGNYSSRAVNKQLGCATLLKGLFEEYNLSTDEKGSIIYK